MPSPPFEPDPAAGECWSRVTELEEKLSFQERAVEELNEVVLRQQGDLERLRAEVASLRAMTERAIDLAREASPPDEKPPHY